MVSPHQNRQKTTPLQYADATSIRRQILLADSSVHSEQVALSGGEDRFDAAWLLESARNEKHHKVQRRILQLLAAVLAKDWCGGGAVPALTPQSVEQSA